MSKLADIKKGDKISFSLIKPGIVGDIYTDVIVDTMDIGFETARYIDSSIADKHANFYLYFKDKVGNVNNPNIYNYIAIKLSPIDSKLLVIGLPWIEESTLKTNPTRKAVITISNFEEFKRNSLETFLNNLDVSYTLEVIEN